MSCQMPTVHCCDNLHLVALPEPWTRLVQAAQQHVNHTDMLVLLTDDENLRGKAHAAGIAAHRSNSLSPRSVHDHLVCRLTLIRHIIADTMPHAMEPHLMAVSPSGIGFWDCRDATALYSQLCLLREPARQVAVIGHVPAMSDSWSASLQHLVQLSTTKGSSFVDLCRQRACNCMQRNQKGSSNHGHTTGSSAQSHISSNHSREHSTSSSQTCDISPSNISRCRSMHTQNRPHACNSSSIRAYTCRRMQPGRRSRSHRICSSIDPRT
jgi:hypothetical protein